MQDTRNRQEEALKRFVEQGRVAAEKTLNIISLYVKEVEEERQRNIEYLKNFLFPCQDDNHSCIVRNVEGP